MSHRVYTAILILCISTALPGGADEEGTSYSIAIHLPRKVVIDSAVPTVGAIGIARGDEAVLAKAEGVSLGRLSVPGQSLTVSRNVLLSRLASNGIAASEVKLTGAKEVVIRQRGRVIEADRFVELAVAHLKQHPPADSISECSLARKPAELALPGAAETVRLVPRVIAGNTPGLARLQIDVVADGVKVGERIVTFQLKYKGRKFAASVDIPAGAMLTTDNVKTEETVSRHPVFPASATPYGMVAKRSIPANTTIKPAMIGPVEPPLILKRNHAVMIRIQRFGLLVTAMGKALEDGRLNEFIKVQNVDSGRIIIGKVKNDGTVEPTF